MYLPEKSFLLIALDPDQKVKLDSLRSADPPINSGKNFPIDSKAIWEHFLVAIGFEYLELKLVSLFETLLLTLSFLRLINSLCKFGYNFLYFLSKLFHSNSDFLPDSLQSQCLYMLFGISNGLYGQLSACRVKMVSLEPNGAP